MNELMARSLSAKELAEQLRYHADPGVAKLALAVINGDLEGPDLAEELSNANDELDTANRHICDMEAVLNECLDELSDLDSARALVKRIHEVL